MLMTTSSLQHFPLDGAGSPQNQHHPSDGLSMALCAVQVPWCAVVPADTLSSLSLSLAVAPWLPCSVRRRRGPALLGFLLISTFL